MTEMTEKILNTVMLPVTPEGEIDWDALAAIAKADQAAKETTEDGYLNTVVLPVKDAE